MNKNQFENFWWTLWRPRRLNHCVFSSPSLTLFGWHLYVSSDFLTLRVPCFLENCLGLTHRIVQHVNKSCLERNERSTWLRECLIKEVPDLVTVSFWVDTVFLVDVYWRFVGSFLLLLPHESCTKTRPVNLYLLKISAISLRNIICGISDVCNGAEFSFKPISFR